MLDDISFACDCGKLQGSVSNSRSAVGPRIVCMCDDCQAYAHYLGNAENILDANGGTDIVPVQPAHLAIMHGGEYLQCMRLSDKGMYRWYAACCRTPIANAMASSKIPYVGLFRQAIRHGDVGPIQARVQAKYGIGELPEDAHPTAPFTIILRILGFLIPGLIKGKYKPTPFFDASGQPTTEPHVLTSAEREQLRG